MSIRAYIIIVSILGAVVGLVLLTIPVSINVGAKSYSCGVATYRNESLIGVADLMVRLDAGPYAAPSRPSGAERCDDADPLGSPGR